MIRVLIADGMEKSAVDSLREKGFDVVDHHYDIEELGEKLKNFDVIVVRSATKVRKPIIDKAIQGKRLKLIIRGGVGVDNIDVSYAEEKGIKVMNTPNASSISVAELVIGHMFSIARFINISNVSMREGKWDKKKYEGIELSGKVLGLIGSGRIASEVLKRGAALGMKILYTNRHGKAEGFEGYEYCELNDLLQRSDFVSLHIPFNKEKGAVIGIEQFNMMKSSSYLINCARGGVVDESALIEALDSGKIAGAAVDVFEEEPTKNEALVKHSKVSVTPHIGASTVEAQERVGGEVVSTIINFFR